MRWTRLVFTLTLTLITGSCQHGAFEKNDRETWSTLYQEASFAERTGDESGALPPSRQAYELAIKAFGSADEKTQASRRLLEAIYRALGRYEEATRLREEILTHDQRVVGENQLDNVDSTRTLGILYLRQGRYDEAIATYERVLRIQQSALGENHEDTRKSMSLLAGMYNEQGRYGEAETVLEQLVKLNRKLLGEADEDTVGSLYRLAGTYAFQKRYEEAEVLMVQAIDLRRKTLGENHIDTIHGMRGLARVYAAQGRYDEAEPIYKEILARFTTTYGDADPITANSMSDLAVLYLKQDRYIDAEPYFKKALDVNREELGKDHRRTLVSINNLASLNHLNGRFTSANALYDEALSRQLAVFGENHPILLNTQLRSVHTLIALGQLTEAVARLRNHGANRLVYTKHELSSTEGAATRALLLRDQASYQDVVMNLALQHPTDETISLAGDVMLSWKQIEAAEAAVIAHIRRTEDDKDVRDLADEIASLRARLSKLTLAAESNQDPVAILEELEAKELALARLSEEFREQKKARRASLDQLQAVLPDRTGLVEFRQYRPVDFETRDQGDPHFAALLVRPEQPPLLIDAGTVKRAERLLQALLDDQLPSRADNAAEALHTQLFAGFAGELEALDKIYISPDGLLHLVPFDRLRLTDGRYWGERQALRALPTGRDLLIKSPSNQATAGGLLALGGIDFGSIPGDGAEIDIGLPMMAAFDRLKIKATRGKIRNIFEAFDPLDASRDEVASIERIYREHRPGDPITVWTGAMASETSLKTLKSLLHPPRVLHFATHGFYLPSSLQTLGRPQLYSGLVMAGANNYLSLDDDEVDAHREDGILYSLEAQDLNLEGTELVVLSACDTGKGVIDYSEGVVGMVQALRIAGAKQVLMTLWPVLDKPTAAFMESFYKNWLTHPSQDPAAALDATKALFRQHENQDYRRPQVWAPFVLVGASGN